MLTQFDTDSAARIGRVVRTVEAQFPRARPLTFGATFNFGFGLDFGPGPTLNGGSASKAFRIGQFSGAWNKGNTKTVTLRNDTARTSVAINLFANVPAPTGTAHCAIAREGTAWYLIAAEC
jgi:hypothetical protein